MRKARKVVALLLIMTLVITSVAMTGCGKTKGKTITLNVYSQTANYQGEQTGWFAKVMLDKFNVKLNIINDADGVYVTRSEAGDLGDIVIFGNDAGQYIDAVNNNLLLDWNEDNLLQKDGSYINDHMQKALEKNQKLNPDGKVHGFGYSVASSAEDHASYFYHPDIRWDLYKQLGYPDVPNLEGYIPVLEQMKQICPTSDAGKETYGVSLFNDWDGNMVMFVKSTAALYGYEEFGIGLYDCKTQTWQDCLADDSIYLRCLKFYNTLYQKGLVDPDSLTQKWDGAQQDYAGGDAFFTLFNYLGSAQYNTDEHLNAGKAMYPLACDDAVTLNNGLNVNGGNRVWAIGANTQYPELCMDIINWLSTPEGNMINYYGPKGYLWDYDANKMPYMTDLGAACRKDPTTVLTGDYTGTYKDGSNQMNQVSWNVDASNPDSAGTTYNYLNWPSWQQTQKFDILDDWRKFTGFTTFDQYLDSKGHVIAPGTTYSEPKRSDDLELKWTQVSKEIQDGSWKAIYAANDADYDAAVAEMKQLVKGYGYDEVAQFYRDEAAKRKALEDEVTK